MKEDTLGDVGEREAIRRLCAGLPTSSDVVVGVGDDAAIVRPAAGSGEDLVLTSDAVILGTHFDGKASPEAVGHKAVARGLSDLAAMGAVPAWALMDLSAPASIPFSYLEGIYRGAARTAAKYELAVVGGDTARSSDLAVHVFAAGRVPRGQARLRSGARPGDALYVTGELGGSILGRHLTFEPRVKEGIWLRGGGWANAMIDLSDGLAMDACHVAGQSSVTLRVVAGSIPVSAAAASFPDGRSAVSHALNDGEDFELLFSVPAGRATEFEAAWRKAFSLKCTKIGSVEQGPGVLVLEDERGRRDILSPKPYDHFGRHSEHE
jgi:thiamine-monophosphate kinase